MTSPNEPSTEVTEESVVTTAVESETEVEVSPVETSVPAEDPTAQPDPVTAAVETAMAAIAPAAEATADAFESSPDQSDNDVAVPEELRDRSNPHVTIVRPVVEDTKTLRNVHGYLDLYARTNEAYYKMRERLGNVDESITDDAGKAWLVSASLAESNILESSIYENPLKRETAEWGQFVEHEGARLAPGMPEFGGTGKKLVGEKAAMKLQGMMGLGATVQIPLWHSGIWISILAPQESELLMLDQMLAEEKIETGSKTGGLAYANEGVYIHNHLINFALNRIYQTTLNVSTPDALKSVIKLTDLFTIAMGLALTIYPTGYHLRVPCIADPKKCQHVTEAHIHLARTFMVDRSALTRDQIKHMVNRKAQYTVDEVKAYQRQGLLADGRTVRVNDDLQIVLKSPTLEEHIQSGFAWIDGMETMIEKSLGASVSLKEKNQFINQQAVLTNLRQYAHWVEKVVYLEEEYEGSESIDPILSMMSADFEVANAFFDGIKKFIDESVVAMIAVPTFACPSCETPMTSAEAEHPEIIPLDPIKLFFALMGHRIIRAKTS